MERERAAPQLLVPELARPGPPRVLVVTPEVGLRPVGAPRVVARQQGVLPAGLGAQAAEEQGLAACRGQPQTGRGDPRRLV